MNVDTRVQSWAAVLWPATVVLWAFFRSSNVVAGWVERLLPGTVDIETNINEENESPEEMETIPD